MTIKFPASEFFQNSGNTAAQFGENLRDQIATFACTIWANFPGFVAEGTNPVQSFTRGYMNQVCSPIQPPVTAPTPPFLGGQCPFAYIWNPTFVVSRPNNALGLSVGDQILGQAVTNPTGPITDTVFPPVPNNAFIVGTALGPAGNNQTTFVFSGANIEFNPPGSNPSPDSVVNVNEVIANSFTPAGGQPDSCGTLPADYPIVTPTSIDLTTTINITNLDGLDNIYTLVFNKTANQYNFPMSFKLNGVNVGFDVGGITIYGSPNIVQPTSGNDVLPPGSDGGDDGVGGNNDTVYDNEYPAFPDITVPEVQDKIIEYVVCNEGVIETITTSLKLVTATIPYASLVIDILGSILIDVCEDEEVAPTIGLPDYYGVRPGIERPAIVYLYKEYINGKWGQSTYSATVHHPTQSAIDNINTIDVPDKNQGTFMVSLSLTDGSRIRVSGNSESSAISNFDFILNQTNPAFIPTNPSTRRVISQNLRLQEKQVKCRQIEYYPDGKLDGTSPLIRRVINPPSMP